MKKTFIVEIDYKELPENSEKNAEVLYAEALEAHIDNLMFSYKQYKNIIGDYEVNVKQI